MRETAMQPFFVLYLFYFALIAIDKKLFGDCGGYSGESDKHAEHAYHSYDYERGYCGCRNKIVAIGNDTCGLSHKLHAYRINQCAYDISQNGSGKHINGIVHTKIDARIAYKY